MANPYQSLNSIPRIHFIAGTARTLTFDVYTDDDGNYNCSGGTPYTLTGLTCYVALAPYGNPGTASVVKQGTVSTQVTNRFTVSLATSDTANLLSGEYIQQPIIVNGSTEIRPGQGLVTILQAIPRA